MPTPHKTLAIVGRPNVGKSAIFNRLAGRRIAIVHDMPGVTRDRISAESFRLSAPITILDTGGIGATLDDGFEGQVRAEAEIAMEAADAILFVVDAREGATSVDEALASVLRRSGSPVLLAINKADTPDLDQLEGEFSHLGFPIASHVSAEHDRGFPVLYSALEEVLKPPAVELDEDGTSMIVAAPLKIALVGRPNAGKSSLINAILEDERTIVSEIAGTTRDSIDIPYHRRGRDYTLIDTAGIRRKRRRPESVEVFSIVRAEKSIRRSDICALVIDVTEGVRAQDIKIARLIQKERKPCIVTLNKFDLYHPDGSFSDRWENLQEEIEGKLGMISYAPQIAVSAKEGHYLKKFFQAVVRLSDLAIEGPTTGALNRLLRDCMIRNPPPMTKGRRFNLLYAVWKKGSPNRRIPLAHFLIFANRAGLLPASYERFLEAQIREQFPFEGLPISFDVRSNKP